MANQERIATIETNPEIEAAITAGVGLETRIYIRQCQTNSAEFAEGKTPADEPLEA
jgi:hypothetical protein